MKSLTSPELRHFNRNEIRSLPVEIVDDKDNLVKIFVIPDAKMDNC